MTEDEARTALRAFVAVGEFYGLRFRVALVPGGVRLTASYKGKGRPAVWTVPGRCGG